MLFTVSLLLFPEYFKIFLESSQNLCLLFAVVTVFL